VTTLLAYLDRTDVTTDIGTTPVPGIATYLSVDAADYPVLRAQYGEAIDWCNEKLSRRDFTAADGFPGDNPPDMAVLGVYAYVKATRDIEARSATGVKKVKTGAREEEYSDAGMGTYLTPGQAAWVKLEPVCEDPTLFASGGA
jgi:hypothetical protein